MAHIMLDIETLGTKPGCIIRSIGACVFAPGGSIPLGNTFYANVDRASCEAFGLVADPETEKWWEQQSEAAKAALTIDPRPLDDVLLDFEDWWRKNRGVEVWCHGATFDAPIVEAAYAAAAKPKKVNQFLDEWIEKFNTLKAEAEDGFLHVSFKHRGINWTACVRLEKAAMFIDSQQRQLPAPKSRPKHIGNDQRRLAFVGGDER